MRPRKQELLDGLIAYLVRHGIADLSLRPMAKDVGTSARLLIFHFRSKENLLAEVLEEMQARLQRSLAERLAAKPGRRRVAPLRTFWNWALQDDNFAYLSLLYHLHMLAIQNRTRYARYLKRNSLNWLDAIQAALPPSRRSPVLATLIGAVFDGLFIEVMSSGDRRRTSQAIDHFIRLAREPAQPMGRRAPRPDHS